jgi:hypothetical protein
MIYLFYTIIFIEELMMIDYDKLNKRLGDKGWHLAQTGKGSERTYNVIVKLTGEVLFSSKSLNKSVHYVMYNASSDVDSKSYAFTSSSLTPEARKAAMIKEFPEFADWLHWDSLGYISPDPAELANGIDCGYCFDDNFDPDGVS